MQAERDAEEQKVASVERRWLVDQTEIGEELRSGAENGLWAKCRGRCAERTHDHRTGR